MMWHRLPLVRLPPSVQGLGCRVQASLGLGYDVALAASCTSASICLGFRVQGLGYRVQGVGFRVQGVGCRVQGVGCRVQGLGFRVLGVGCGGQLLDDGALVVSAFLMNRSLLPYEQVSFAICMVCTNSYPGWEGGGREASTYVFCTVSFYLHFCLYFYFYFYFYFFFEIVLKTWNYSPELA